MHICIITPKYPTIADPTALTFVQQLVWTMADVGEKVSVICPLGINRNKQYKKVSSQLIEKSFLGKDIEVYFPRFLDCGQKNILSFNTAGITTFYFSKAVENVLNSMHPKPDVLYGHFITPSGVTASILGNKMGIASFVAYGESTPWTIYQLGVKKVKKYLANVNGVISVSSANKKELIDTGVVNPNKIEVFPNGYRASRFFQKDRKKARKIFNIPEDAFVVAFVGHFIERKGIHKLLKAIDELEDVYLICAGKGPIEPKGEKVLFAAPVDPDELSTFYSAADIFVLPTQNEGCCNAIIEAMACGLPIVSSNLQFNDDILNNENSIRINPEDEHSIVEAIITLKKDSVKRCQLANGSLRKARALTLEVRATNIISFIKNKTGKQWSS